MSVTPNYSWPLIEPTDFVTNLPADFEAFGDAVDATVDGIDDRVTDLEVITTEGDLIVGDASGDPVRVPVGTIGQILASDGDTVEWVNAASASPLLINPIGKNLYVWGAGNRTTNSQNQVQNRINFTPIFLNDCTIDSIRIRSGTTVTGNAFYRLGIYNNSASNFPSTVLVDAGTVQVNVINTDFSIAISQTISAGWYWLAAKNETNQTTQIQSHSSFGNQPIWHTQVAFNALGIRTTSTHVGAFPTLASTDFTNDIDGSSFLAAPAVQVRIV